MTPPTCQTPITHAGTYCNRPAAVRLFQTPEQQTLDYAMDGWYCDGCATLTEHVFARNGGGVVRAGAGMRAVGAEGRGERETLSHRC